MSNLTKIRNPHVAAILLEHGWTDRGSDDQGRRVLEHPYIGKREARRCVTFVMQGNEVAFYMERYGQLYRPPPPPPEVLWRTKDGQTLRLCEIEDLHLMNIIAQCRRRKKPDERLPALIEEAERRGFSTVPN